MRGHTITTRPANRDRFENLACRHYAEVLRVARGMVGASVIVEDLVQDSFIAAFQKFDRYDPECNFVGWMRAIVRHRFLRFLNDRRRRELPYEPAALQQLVERGDDRSENRVNDRKAQMPLLAECVRALPEQLRRAIELSYLENLSGAEVALRMDLSEGNVRQRLHRGRAKLRQLMTAKMKHKARVLAA